ncbi:MAG TPA: Zn-dependent alcohol dehydrogenase [Acidimicrobiales bacterium]|jgi:S-(hydroxymethyl)glutathione dehydrogenase/alcohol dehydrogenase|nr:Zn-dependent alcohol dehydrogenase [Acidimicrobiales bacterium]
MKVNAAVLHSANLKLDVVELDLAAPHAHEVLVKVVASGVCGTDLHAVEGDRHNIYGYPMVPGHEAAGIVEDVGPGVSEVAPGDHVLINLMPGCGTCPSCCLGNSRGCRNAKPGRMLDGTTRMTLNGRPVYQMAFVGSFAEYLVVAERSCIVIGKDVPLTSASLIGCGVATGWSAVYYIARVQPGASAVVFGCGGVGLNVIQCLKLAHAGTIVAVDVSPIKLEMAKKFGATRFVDASVEDPVVAVRDFTGGGADFAFEVISGSRTVKQAFDATAPGGMLTVVGVTPDGDEVTIPAGIRKTVTSGGWSHINAWRDFPLLVDLYMRGELKVDELISKHRPLTEVNDALADLKSGTVARTVLTPHG